jgi:hypothetical protein
VPEHWTAFGKRRGGNCCDLMYATTFGDAILNYLYSIVEAVTRAALWTVGLDSSVGRLHTDKNGRASLALDVMEPARPDVDAWLLDVLERRVFSPSEFAELPDSDRRISTKVARELSEIALRWRSLIGPVVEQVASAILASHRPAAKLALHLTHTHHRTAARRSLAHRTEPGSVDVPPIAAIPSVVAPPVKVAARCIITGRYGRGGIPSRVKRERSLQLNAVQPRQLKSVRPARRPMAGRRPSARA